MRNLFISIFITTFFCINTTYASVVMTGTRIIYPAQMKEKTVQLRNPDDKPYLVQVQVDDREDVKADDEPSASFVITPQIFRIESGSGQSIRLKYVGENIPQDRESIFYFSFSQLPILKKSEQVGNQLILAITTRVKIFYRPDGIAGNPSDIAKSLVFKVNGKRLQVSNPTGYHAVVKKATLSVNGKETTLADSVLIAPKSVAEWTPAAPSAKLSGNTLRLVLVNDYGVDVVTKITL